MNGGTTSVVSVGRGAPQPCKICGATASFTNFGVVSCSSCKMFFKRNAEAVKNRFVCDLDNQCVIDVNSRRTCSACRLTKCFTSGMQIALIRSPRMHKNTKRKKKCAPTSSTAVGWHGNNDNQQLPTLNLLRADRSTLNIDQWTLLSNLIHCFDEPNELRLAHQFITQQNALPPKYRYKPEAAAAFTVESSKRAQCVFERNEHYRSLCPRDRSTLFRCVVKHTGGMAGTFILHQSRLLYDPSFDQSCRAVFGNDLLTRIIFLAESFDEDATFFKLIAASLTFSTMRYTDYDAVEQNNLTDVKRVIQIQDIYVDLAWRYMTYRYSYHDVVKRFSLLVRYLLRTINGLIEVEKAAQHNQTIDRILEKTDAMTINE